MTFTKYAQAPNNVAFAQSVAKTDATKSLRLADRHHGLAVAALEERHPELDAETPQSAPRPNGPFHAATEAFPRRKHRESTKEEPKPVAESAEAASEEPAVEGEKPKENKSVKLKMRNARLNEEKEVEARLAFGILANDFMNTFGKCIIKSELDSDGARVLYN